MGSLRFPVVMGRNYTAFAEIRTRPGPLGLPHWIANEANCKRDEENADKKTRSCFLKAFTTPCSRCIYDCGLIARYNVCMPLVLQGMNIYIHHRLPVTCLFFH